MTDCVFGDVRLAAVRARRRPASPFDWVCRERWAHPLAKPLAALWRTA